MSTKSFQQLEQDLKTIGQIHRSQEAVLSVDAKQAIRDQVMRGIGRWEVVEVLTEPAQVSWFKKMLGGNFKSLSFSLPVTVLVVTLSFLATATTATLAHSAVPGDKLYGWNKAFENLSIILASGSPIKQAELKLQYADNRLRDLNYANPSSPEALNKVLNESQEAVKRATLAIKDLDDSDTASSYLNRLEGLLNTQKGILDELSTKESLPETTKQTIVAIKAELAATEPGETEEEPIKKEVAVVKPEAKPGIEKVQLPSTDSQILPATGSQEAITLVGYIGTAFDRPVLIIGNTYYRLQNSSINFRLYLNTQEKVTVRGALVDGVVQVTEFIIGDKVIFAPNLTTNAINQ